MPTLLTELGAPVPEMAAGRVVDLRRPTPTPADAVYVAQANAPFVLSAFRYADGKAIFFVSPEQQAEVYDPIGDRGERQDLAATPHGQELLSRARRDRIAFQERTEALRKRFQLYPEVRSKDRMSPEMLEELTALGYLAGDEEEPEEDPEQDSEEG